MDLTDGSLLPPRSCFPLCEPHYVQLRLGDDQQPGLWVFLYFYVQENKKEHLLKVRVEVKSI